MTEFELQKLRSAMLYILNLKGSMGIFHLFKILYFADREHMSRYGRRIINDTFCAMRNGPVPSLLYNILNNPVEMAKSKDKYAIFLNTFTRGSDDAYYVVLPEKDLCKDEYEVYLSKSDKECLKASYDENIKIPFELLSKKSHDEAWNEAWKRSTGGSNSIKPILSAKSAGADNEMLSHIEEMDEIAEYLMNI